MKIIETIKNIGKRRKAAKKFGVRSNNTKATVLYWYFMVGGVAGLVYGISCIWTGLPFVYAFSVMFLFIAWMAFKFLLRNFKVVWMGISDINRGRFLMHLSKMTEFSDDHKLKAVKWVYPRRGEIRNERLLFLNNKIYEGGELSKDERLELDSFSKRVTCPQQLLDGVQKAIFIDALIYSHENIEVLDDSIRDIMELTDERMAAFDLSFEIDKCRTSESKAERVRLMRIGLERTGQLKDRYND